MDLKVLFLLTFFIISSFCDIDSVRKKLKRLVPCEACKLLVKSFEEGMKRTSHGNFAGGDTAWEEEKLGSYYNSEVRLVEIHEKLCLEVEEGQAQCHNMAEMAEDHLEEWWFKKRELFPNLEKWLCIKTMNFCCEAGRYGPKCLECPGYPDAICNGRGKCQGSGMRSGTGQCICDPGYSGRFCDQCAERHFTVHDADGNHDCSPCHVSCDSGCSDNTPSGCNDCKTGWQMGDAGCVDVDECESSATVCKDNEVCINNKGSYKCRDIAHLGTKDSGKWVRYVTYIGFLIATVVFLRKDWILGCVVGIIAALYVTASEMLMSDQIDVRKFDLKSM